MNIVDPAIIEWLAEQAAKAAAGSAFKSGIGFLGRRTASLISATGLRSLISFVPNESERRFLDRAKDQVDESVFPWTQHIQGSFAAIQLRTIALGGEQAIGHLGQFVDDRVDLFGIELEETGKRIADEILRRIGRILVSSECSSPSSILMTEIASHTCPVFKLSVEGVTPDSQLHNLQNGEAEVAIIANAPYMITSRDTIRDEYKFYCPLYPSYNHLYVRGHRRVPLRRVFILEETSGLEQQRMGKIGDGLPDISLLDVSSSYQIRNEINEGEAVVIWPPLTKELRDSGFRELKHGAHETWIGLYFRKDLMGSSPGATQNRRQVVKMLAWSWEKMRRKPLIEIYASIPGIRSRLASYWPD